MIGRTLAHYRITAALGAGGMGEVYRALDTRLDREVALKVLPTETARDAGSLERFRREARALAMLDHPNIVTVYSVEEADGIPFLTMQLVDGVTLDAVIPNGGLPIARFFEIAVPLAEALAAAHGKEIVHRDLKPGNVMVSRDGRVKVLDFGIAKTPEAGAGYDDRTRTSGVTAEGAIVGTAPYMSPEQIEGKPVGPRSDLFSLGIVLYEMLAGRRPFEGGSWPALVSSILRDDPPALSRNREDVPAAVVAMIARCLEKDPARRDLTAGEVASALRGVGTGGAVAAAVALNGSEPVPSIAVLPFADMSATKDQDYLCEGMAEEIMNALVGVGGIRVSSRMSTFRASAEAKDLAELGRMLSVGHALEGSVRTAGKRLRVTARLSDVVSGFQLWSERYDREAEDVFAVQDEIAAGVTEAVSAQLTPVARPARPRTPVADVEAYRLYLKGRHYRYTKNDHGAAILSYGEAIALDPSHAPSHLGLAEVTVLAALYGIVRPRDAFARAREELAIARRLGGTTADGSYVEGMIAYAERDWAAADHALCRAVEISPDHIQALCWLGMARIIVGLPGENEEPLRRARELDPLAPYPYAMTGACRLIAGRWTESRDPFEQTLAFDPENSLALWGLGIAEAALGNAQTSVELLERAAVGAHRGGFIGGAHGWALANAGRNADARAVLDRLRARPEPAAVVVSEAWIHAALGDHDAAFDILERSLDDLQGFAPFVRLPGLDPLRDDPRFEAFVARLGLVSND